MTPVTELPLQRERAKTIFEKGAAGRRAFVCPELDVPEVNVDELLPERLRRRVPPRLPEVSEPEIVRHYVGLSKRNFDLDSGFYPLGSCTMKTQPAPTRAGCSATWTRTVASTAGPGAGAGRTRADVEPAAGARGDLGPASRLAAAFRGLPRRARCALLYALITRPRASTVTRC